MEKIKKDFTHPRYHEEKIKKGPLEIISFSDVQKLWQKNLGLKIREVKGQPFPQKVIDEIINHPSKNEEYFIIYLSGASIKDLRNLAYPNLQFENSALSLEEFTQKGKPGYALISLRQKRTKYSLAKKKFLRDLPPGWQGASLREATEVILNLFLVLQEKKYTREWHFPFELLRKDSEEERGKIRGVKLLYRKGQLTVTYKSVDEYLPLNSMMIRFK